MLFHNEGLVAFTEALLGIAATISAESLSELSESDHSTDFNQLTLRRLHYFSYAVSSFCIVALVRRSHIQMYRFIGFGNHVVMGLNFVELALVCLIPVAFIGLQMTEEATPIALCAGLLSAIFAVRLLTLYYARDCGLWGQPLESSTHASVQDSDAAETEDYAGTVGLVPGQEEAYSALQAQFMALSAVAALLALVAGFTTRLAGVSWRATLGNRVLLYSRLACRLWYGELDSRASAATAGWHLTSGDS